MQNSTTQQSLIPLEIPSNTYKPKEPLKAKLIENTRLTSTDSINDVRHLVFDLTDNNGLPYEYIEGQSAGIVPPGETPEGRPHKLRLYSIASAGIGDDKEGKTLSLCVKRLVYTDPETGEEKFGVCSNFLCDLEVGSTVNMTGPVGKAFIMPDEPNANLVMIATGTGIAPFRAFLDYRYNQRPQDTGEQWLFFGVQTHHDYLYKEELEAYNNNDSYHLVTAFSREEKTEDGHKMYVQNRLYQYGKELFALMSKPNTYVYICGLKGMETGIHEALEKYGSESGQSWEELLNQLKAEKRWRVEVY